jgi:hypothetical protein
VELLAALRGRVELLAALRGVVRVVRAAWSARPPMVARARPCRLLILLSRPSFRVSAGIPCTLDLLSRLSRPSFRVSAGSPVTRSPVTRSARR